MRFCISLFHAQRAAKRYARQIAVTRKRLAACPNSARSTLSDRGWQQPLDHPEAQPARRVKDAEGTAKPLVLDSVRWLGYSATHISNAAPYPTPRPPCSSSPKKQIRSESPNASAPDPNHNCTGNIPVGSCPLCCATRIARYVAAASNLASCAPAASPNIFCAKPLTSPRSGRSTPTPRSVWAV